MRTLADFKRRLAVGTKVHTTYHAAFAGRDEKGQVYYKDEDKGIREVSIVQSNSFAFKTPKSDGTFHDSWCAYPKAKEFKIVDENTVTIFEEDSRTDEKKLIPILTYKFV